MWSLSLVKCDLQDAKSSSHILNRNEVLIVRLSNSSYSLAVGDGITPICDMISRIDEENPGSCDEKYLLLKSDDRAATPVKNAFINTNGELVLILDDGSEFNAGRARGVGISEIYLNEQSHLIFKLDDNNSVDLGGFLRTELPIPIAAIDGLEDRLTTVEEAVDTLPKMTEDIQEASIVGNEGKFGVYALLAALTYELNTFMYETFSTSSDIDQTKDDGTYVVTNYFNAVSRAIIKNDDTTKTIQSVKVTSSTPPTKVWARVDYEGTGSVTIQFSRDDGSTWTTVPNDSCVTLSTSLNSSLRLRLTLKGIVKTKNVAWGCK